MTARKSDGRKALEGTHRADRARGRVRASGQPLARLPLPPAHLDGVGRAAWKEVGGVLLRGRRLLPEDVPLLRMYAEAEQTARAAAAALERDGLTVAGPRGTTKSHPASAVLSQARSLARNILGDLGCSPKSRGFEMPPTSTSPNDKFFDW